MFAAYIDHIIMYVVTRIQLKKCKQAILKNSNGDVMTSTDDTINLLQH